MRAANGAAPAVLQAVMAVRLGLLKEKGVDSPWCAPCRLEQAAAPRPSTPQNTDVIEPQDMVVMLAIMTIGAVREPCRCPQPFDTPQWAQSGPQEV